MGWKDDGLNRAGFETRIAEMKEPPPISEKQWEALLMAWQDPTISNGLRERVGRSIHDRMIIHRITRH